MRVEHRLHFGLGSHIDIHDEAGMAALNDCVYHNMKNVKYLLMIDLDEFIVPHMNNTLQEMLEFLNSKEIKMKSGRQVRSGRLASSYNFKNAFFYPNHGKYGISFAHLSPYDIFFLNWHYSIV